ncbi:hypothetical protein CEUSTIGMA_g11316.t1 [Chlamydomonas eustigma]|uniref:FAM86 N-terminal domain-containing protein n=1 Tax=Chlamydomonas eustigma TaxID=1157962 RepID=A0A250XLB3_9CHLO|nr:hypothetical protein CEUSTIGMA_g11316.t1 [Chlamydomonas eustigma]|eukprot:GAX83891.1 hypothetical protein CEUSTIGMA_g11316.t1 [Chlamydomonas eustigma]
MRENMLYKAESFQDCVLSELESVCQLFVSLLRMGTDPVKVISGHTNMGLIVSHQETLALMISGDPVLNALPPAPHFSSKLIKTMMSICEKYGEELGDELFEALKPGLLTSKASATPGHTWQYMTFTYIHCSLLLRTPVAVSDSSQDVVACPNCLLEALKQHADILNMQTTKHTDDNDDGFTDHHHDQPGDRDEGCTDHHHDQSGDNDEGCTDHHHDQPGDNDEGCTDHHHDQSGDNDEDCTDHHHDQQCPHDHNHSTSSEGPPSAVSSVSVSIASTTSSHPPLLRSCDPGKDVQSCQHSSHKLSNLIGSITLHACDNLLEGSTGCHPWEAGFSLAQYVLSYAEEFKGCSVMELGCGLGLLGACLHHVGAGSIILTDGDPQTLRNCQANLALNGISVHGDKNTVQPAVVCCHLLRWQDEDVQTLLDTHGGSTPDIILGSDILYDSDTFPDLLKTVKALLSEAPQSGYHSSYQAESLRDRCDDPEFLSLVKENPTAFMQTERGILKCRHKSHHRYALIATNIRNQDTFQLFKSQATTLGLHLEDCTERLFNMQFSFLHRQMRECLHCEVLTRITIKR